MLYAERLERARFVFPGDTDAQELSKKALRFILDGIALGSRRLASLSSAVEGVRDDAICASGGARTQTDEAPELSGRFRLEIPVGARCGDVRRASSGRLG